MSLVTLAFLVGLVALIGSIVYLVLKALDLFRVGKTFFRDVGPMTDELGRSLDRLAAHEPPDAGRLSEATARLRASQARLAVQLDAIRRVREQWAALLAVYPRK